MTLALIANGLFFAFAVCCLASAGLQLIAWSRHANEGARISFLAFWRPDGHFDDIGLQQMRTARRLLTIGMMAYLGYGAILIVMAIAGSA